MDYKTPYNHLIKDSQEYITLVSSKEYLSLQSNFDKLHLEIKDILKCLKIILTEIDTNPNKFTKISEQNNLKNIETLESSLDKNINKMNKEIKKIENNTSNPNFVSRF